MSSNNSKAAVSFDSVAAEAKIHELFKGSLDEDYQVRIVLLGYGGIPFIAHFAAMARDVGQAVSRLTRRSNEFVLNESIRDGNVVCFSKRASLSQRHRNQQGEPSSSSRVVQSMSTA